MKEVTIPARTRLWASTLGHYRFHYPDDNKPCRTTYPVGAQVLNYVGDRTRDALYIPRLKKVFWIDKETLKCIS